MYELSPSVLEIKVVDAMATFYSNVEKQSIQAMDPKKIQKCYLLMVNAPN